MIKFKTEQGEYTSPRMGDYVLAENMPTQDKHEAVVDAFEKCGFVHTDCADWGGVDSDGAEWDRVLFTSRLLTGLPCATWAVNSINCERRIIPVFEEKKTLFEAACEAEDGARFIINPNGNGDIIVEKKNNALVACYDDFEPQYISNISYLSLTDFEQLPSGPKKRDVRQGQVIGEDSVYIPADKMQECIDAFKLIGRLMQWEGAQIGEAGYSLCKFDVKAHHTNNVLPYEVTFETEEQCIAAWDAECPELFE